MSNNLYYNKQLLSGICKVPRLTQSEYDALTTKPEFWILKDSSGSYKRLNADEVEYDNADSTLTSTNVQDAIEEINDNKVDKETGKGLFSGSYTDLTNKPTVNKVYQENSTGAAPYRVLLSQSYNDTSEDAVAKKSSKLTFNPSTGVLNQQGNLFVNRKDGTTSAQGYSDIYVGNAAATGSAENSKGRIILYANSKYYTIINAKDGMSNYRSVDLPDASGTVALTSDFSAIKTKSNVTPTSSGKSTLLSYILDVLQPLGYSTYTFAAFGFSDLPSTDWGYTLTVYFEAGAILVQALKHQSNFNIFYRGVSASSQWIGSWVAK